MIELIEGLPAPVVGLRVGGEVTRQDYERVLLPAVRAMRESHDRIRLLYVLGADFDGYSAGRSGRTPSSAPTASSPGSASPSSPTSAGSAT